MYLPRFLKTLSETEDNWLLEEELELVIGLSSTHFFKDFFCNAII